MKKICKVTFWKFVSHPVSTTFEQAEALAKRIEALEFVPLCSSAGDRFYKSGGWCYDIGRKPFLVEYSHGHIQRHWAMSISELRKACYLSRSDKVVPDPFFKSDVMEYAEAA